MDDEQIRSRIAEAMGYERRPDGFWREIGHVGSCGIPDYPNDLNACAEAVRKLTYDERNQYLNILCGITYEAGMDDVDADFAWLDATARQRCEAFLRTKGLWEDAQ